MDYNNFRERIYYVDKKRLLIYALLSLAMYSCFEIALIYDSRIIHDFVKIFKIILVMISLMFAMHLKSITQKELYGVLKIFFVILWTVSMIFFTPNSQFEDVKILLRKVGCGTNYEFSIFHIVILYYIMAKYRLNKKNDKFIYFEYFILILITSTINFINNITDLDFIYKIYYLVIILIVMRTYRYFKIYTINVEKKIDLLKLNVNLLTLKILVSLSTNYINIFFINDVVKFVKIIIFTSTVLIIIVNIAKENYNFIFKETVKTNKNLEDINKEIIYNNYKLEEVYRNLNEKQLLYKRFLGCLPNPIVIINNNLRIYYCNDKFLDIMEVNNLKKIVNRRIDNYIDFKCDIRDIISDINNRPVSITINKGNKKLEVRFFSMNAEKSEFILLLKDLTEEIKLSNMKEELESIKMREEIKRNFLSNISHDLKIPINVIYSAIQLEKVLIQNDDIEKLSMYNELSKQNCFILTKFTNNLIDMSKIDSENLEANLGLDNIVEFIEDYLNSLSTYIKNSGIDIVFDTEEEEEFVYFDKEMMQRIILNLVSNSLKFTKENGTIFINIKSTNNYVMIDIGDNGIGMSEEFIKKAFNKYEMENRTKESNPTGFGVGLFVVYNLVKAQNGDIEINSTVGQGTIFTIKLYR